MLIDFFMNNNTAQIKIKILSALFVFISIFTNSLLTAQNKASYIIPDIGAPGTSVYIELIGYVDAIGAFGNNTFIDDNSLYLAPKDPNDK